VVEEVAEHYVRWAADGPVSASAFWQRWQEEYLPLLRIVEVPTGLLSTAETRRVERLAAVDPDDVPSVTLTLLFGGFFLSEDARACRAVYGEATSAGQRRQWLEVLQAGGDAGQLRSLLHGGAFGGVVACRGLAELVRLLLRRPWLMLPAAGLAAAAVSRWPPERLLGGGRRAAGGGRRAAGGTCSRASVRSRRRTRMPTAGSSRRACQCRSGTRSPLSCRRVRC